MVSLLLLLLGAAANPPAPARRALPSRQAPSVVLPARPAPPRIPARPPRVPEGMSPCLEPLRPTVAPSRAVGETMRYLIDVDGLSVGTIDFKIERRGAHDGQQVVEYRSLFQLDALVAAFVPVRGQAAALVPEGGFWPVKAMNRYDLRADHFEEEVVSDAQGKLLRSERLKNGEKKTAERRFLHPVLDFISAFYAVRALPAEASGCVVIYGNQRAYTVWMSADGEERVQTPAGMRPARRYRVVYASERSRAPIAGRIWLSADAARVPYRAELDGRQKLVGRIHVYETGRP